MILKRCYVLLLFVLLCLFSVHSLSLQRRSQQTLAAANTRSSSSVSTSTTSLTSSSTEAKIVVTGPVILSILGIWAAVTAKSVEADASITQGMATDVLGQAIHGAMRLTKDIEQVTSQMKVENAEFEATLKKKYPKKAASVTAALAETLKALKSGSEALSEGKRNGDKIATATFNSVLEHYAVEAGIKTGGHIAHHVAVAVDATTQVVDAVASSEAFVGFSLSLLSLTVAINKHVADRSGNVGAHAATQLAHSIRMQMQDTRETFCKFMADLLKDLNLQEQQGVSTTSPVERFVQFQMVHMWQNVRNAWLCKCKPYLNARQMGTRAKKLDVALRYGCTADKAPKKASSYNLNTDHSMYTTSAVNHRVFLDVFPATPGQPYVTDIQVGVHPCGEEDSKPEKDLLARGYEVLTATTLTGSSCDTTKGARKMGRGDCFVNGDVQIGRDTDYYVVRLWVKRAKTGIPVEDIVVGYGSSDLTPDYSTKRLAIQTASASGTGSTKTIRPVNMRRDWTGAGWFASPQPLRVEGGWIQAVFKWGTGHHPFIFLHTDSARVAAPANSDSWIDDRLVRCEHPLWTPVSERNVERTGGFLSNLKYFCSTKPRSLMASLMPTIRCANRKSAHTAEWLKGCRDASRLLKRQCNEYGGLGSRYIADECKASTAVDTCVSYFTVKSSGPTWFPHFPPPGLSGQIDLNPGTPKKKKKSKKSTTTTTTTTTSSSTSPGS